MICADHEKYSNHWSRADWADKLTRSSSAVTFLAKDYRSIYKQKSELVYRESMMDPFFARSSPC